jgi:hypothetical protein
MIGDDAQCGQGSVATRSELMKTLWILAAAATFAACHNRSDEDMGAAPDRGDSTATAPVDTTAAQPTTKYDTTATAQPTAPSADTSVTQPTTPSVTPTDTSMSQPAAPSAGYDTTSTAVPPTGTDTTMSPSAPTTDSTSTQR